jgi:acyl carrier protein
MKREEIEIRLRKIFHDLFNCDPASINADSSPDNVGGWDSMQHLNLVTSIEQEFEISLDEQQVVEMLSFGLIVEILDQALKSK